VRCLTGPTFAQAVPAGVLTVHREQRVLDRINVFPSGRRGHRNHESYRDGVEITPADILERLKHLPVTTRCGS